MKTLKIFPSFLLAVLIHSIVGCNKEEINLPTISTFEVSEITQSTAVSGGCVTDDGGAKITAKGVVWGTTENPTVETNDGLTNDGIGVGEFVSNLSDIQANTIYYVRAYATNVEGTEYGNQITFNTLEYVYCVTKISISDEETCEGDGTNISNYDIDITYDNSNRVARFDFVVEGEQNYSIVFTYGSDGKLLKVMDENEDYVEYTWDGDKVTAQWYRYYEGEYYYDGKQVIELNASGDVQKIERYYMFDYKSDWVMYSNDVFTWQNGNITKIEEYYTSYGKESRELIRKNKFSRGFNKSAKVKFDTSILASAKEELELELEYTSTYTYDSKNNGIRNAEALRLWQPWEVMFQTKNNVLTSTWTDHWADNSWGDTFSYEYNSDDYPATMEYSREGDWCNRSTLWTFTYDVK